jgi:carbonic anhydrase/acetyltransferase-like protein (isoleucine patch superfamily)
MQVPRASAAFSPPGFVITLSRKSVCIFAETGMPLYALDDWRPELPPEGQCWIAPNATLIGRVRLLPGASVWFGAVLRGDNDWITVGERTNIQDLCVLHTDPGFPIHLGANVTIGHGVVLHGAAVGDNTVIGMGATLLNKATIGKNSIVGAHTLIPEKKEFPDNSLIVGVPGKAIRSIPEDQHGMLTLNAQIYFDRWQRYRHELTRID